jgi:uncharacterized membrane protein YeaQ/YmgE (transglycosylase-associated protein family)
MEIVWFILIGLCAGWLAAQITKVSGLGLVGNVVVGVVGALLGGFLFRQMGVATSGLGGQLIVATVGAIVLLVLLRLVQNKPKA